MVAVVVNLRVDGGKCAPRDEQTGDDERCAGDDVLGKESGGENAAADDELCCECARNVGSCELVGEL